MIMRRRFTATMVVFALGLAASCSKKKESSDTEESTITVTGQLSLAGESTSFSLADTPALEDLDVYCVTFTMPPVAGSGGIDATGAFSLTLDTTDASVGCFILNDTTVLGSIVFEDPSKTDMAGGTSASDRLAFSGGKTDLGAFTLDLATGKAVVDITKITTSKLKDTSSAAAAAVDFTGSYIISSSGLDLPTGYVGTCTREERETSDDCNGPTEGEPLFVKTFPGVSVATGKPIHGAMLWQSEELFDECGGKLGISYAAAEEHGVDFSASGLDEGEFDWSPGYVDGWKKTTATAKHSIMKMENVDDFKGYPGMKQYFEKYRTFSCEPNTPCNPETSQTTVTAPGFQFNANTKETGCLVDGKPYQMNDWSGMECEFTQLTGASSGLTKNVCTKTVSSKTVTCTHIGGTFLADGTAIPNAMTRYPDDYVVYANGAYCDYNNNSTQDQDEWAQWNGSEMACNGSTTLTAGDLCSSIPTTSDEGALAQLRCYLEDGNNRDNEVEGCMREVRGNWSAQTPEEFIGKQDGPVKAKGEHVFELFEYDSATSGSMRGEDREFRGIQVGDNWTDCEVINVFALSMRKIDGSENLLAEMVESQRNVSNKPACIAEYGEGKTVKMLFTLEKQ